MGIIWTNDVNRTSASCFGGPVVGDDTDRGEVFAPDFDMRACGDLTTHDNAMCQL